MQRLSLLLGLVVLSAGLALLAWRSKSQPASAALQPADVVQSSEEPAAAEIVPVEPGDAARSEARESVPLAVAPATSSPLIEAPAMSRKTKIHGRFVHPNAQPIQGVRLIETQAGEGDLQHSVSNEDGNFEFDLEEAAPFPLALRASYSGHVVPHWKWDRIAPGADIDLGTLVLIREALLRVRVVDEEGQFLKGDVVVFAAAEVQSTQGKVPFIHAEAPLDGTSGEALLEGLPPETVFVSARSPLFGSIGPEPIDLVPGATTEATLIYRGPALQQRITVGLPASEALARQVRPEEVRLLSPEGKERASSRAAGSEVLVFDGLSEGRYQVFLGGERWRPWSQSGVQPGERVDPDFVGRCTLLVEVVDKETGASIEECKISAEEPRWSGSGQPRIHYTVPTTAPRRIDGVLPGRHVFTASATGFIAQTLPMVDIQPDELPVLRFELERGGLLRGRVVMSDGGVPDQAIDVRLALPVDLGRKSRDSNGDGLPDRPKRLAWQTFTDAEGLFQFTGLREGQYAVRAEWNAGVSATQTLAILPGQTREVELTLPGRTRMTGRVLLPEGETTEGLQLAMIHRDVQVAAVLRKNGDFDVVDVAPGNYKLSLLIPVRDHVVSYDDERPALLPLGSVTLVEHETTTVQLDARECFPGSLTLELSLPEEWVVVGEARLHPREAGLSGRIGVSLTPEGHAIFPRVPPGRWSVSIELEGLLAKFQCERIFKVLPHSSLVERVQLHPARDSLRFRLHGEVLPTDVAVLVTPFVGGEPTGRRSLVQPDANGAATLGLLAGSYHFSARNVLAEELGTAVVEWTASGPATEVVDLR